jgi:ATP-binding cassette subfamily B protein
LAQTEDALPEAEAAVVQHGAVSLEVEGLEIRFESGRGLGPISLAIPTGGSLAVLGGIGSGKTLLLQVLAGLRQPQQGIFKVGGAQMDIARTRKHWASLGWVPQEAALFSGSLRENLSLGNPGATEEDIWEVARAVCLEDLIHRLPDGLDTVVGERGVILSGGERQRAALARALLRRPGVLLMDDSLSAVDAETESRILLNLGAYLGKTTLVLATHRIFVAELCERAVVLKHGRLVQSGAPIDLSAADGPYAKIRRLQSL